MMQQLPLPRPRSPRAWQRQWRRDVALIQFVIAGAIVVSLCTLLYLLGPESAEAARRFASLG